MSRRMTSTQSQALTGMFTAVLAVFSQIQLPMPSGMPVTMQTFAVALAGFVLGSRSGAAAVGIYILAGAVGIPVFAGFAGGPAVIFGMRGGFIWGFLFLVFGCGIVCDKRNMRPLFSCFFPAIGLIFCHLAGIMQFALVMKMDFFRAWMLVSAPYLIKDMASVFVAFVVGKAIRNGMKGMFPCA